MRITAVSLSMGLALVAAGCDHDPAPGPVDLAMDLARLPDLHWIPDFPHLHGTGEPCLSSGECAPSKAPGHGAGKCLKNTMLGGVQVTWPGGYCQEPCRTSKNDADGINRVDCTGEDAVCVTDVGGGLCYAGCTSLNDCRDGYACAAITGARVGACVPLEASQCDPPGDPLPQGRSCPMGRRCASVSPDGSFGFCFSVCDPVAQDCPPEIGPVQCDVYLDFDDGAGTCNGISWPGPGPCQFINDCGSGQACIETKCRAYCRTGGAPCPMGLTCRDIPLPGVKFHADKTGVCLP